jgi:hypothetical protein
MTPAPNPLQHKLNLAFRCHFPQFKKNHFELVILVVLALIQAQTVLHSKLAERIPGLAQQSSVLRRIERFFQSHPVTQADIAPLILACFPKNEKLTFVLDRTNWKLGSQDINVLVLAVLYKNIAIPLIWDFLTHSGNSPTPMRIDLIDDLLTLVSPARVKVILGDREFVGKAWLNALWERGLSFCMRIKDDTRLDEQLAGVFFSDLKVGTIIVMGHEMRCYGLPLNVSATLSSENKRVMVASNLSSERLLEVYRTRWRIECLFRHLKTKGFNLESTHMVEQDKLERLICVLVMAYLWCVLLGKRQRIKKKKHGHLSKAVFRAGLERFTRGMVQVGELLEAFIKELIEVLTFSPHQSVG